ncbi:MAG: hypothetical protein AAF417_23765, partial [Pseudomonadota bacterium]
MPKFADISLDPTSDVCGALLPARSTPASWRFGCKAGPLRRRLLALMDVGIRSGAGYHPTLDENRIAIADSCAPDKEQAVAHA